MSKYLCHTIKIGRIANVNKQRCRDCAYHVLVQPNFRRYYFYFLPDSSPNSPQSFQRFRQSLVPNLIQIRLRVKNLPIDQIVKIGRFWQRNNIAKSGKFLQWGSMGKFFIRCRIQLKFCLRIRLKR